MPGDRKPLEGEVIGELRDVVREVREPLPTVVAAPAVARAVGHDQPYVRVGGGARDGNELVGGARRTVKDAHRRAAGVAELQPREIAAVRQPDHACVELLHGRTFAPGRRPSKHHPP